LGWSSTGSRSGATHIGAGTSAAPADASASSCSDCARAFCFSELHAKRLREEGLRGPVTVLRGLYAGSAVPAAARPAEPIVLFAGRLIPEKQVTLAVAAMALAVKRIAGLRGEFLGDGPERAALDAAIAAHELQGIVVARGFAVTSRREGYGLVVVEAAARGTPSVVLAGEDNAATELIEEGVNGFVAANSEPEQIAAAIERVHEAGLALRESTTRWFAENAGLLALESSLRKVLEVYADGGRSGGPAGSKDSRPIARA
jgi:glycosyltransferase involved in cell wall biosynthesis